MEELPKGVLIIGSVPLKNAEEVFRVCGQKLGSCLISLPDGETGDRLSWLGHQRARFDRHPQLERPRPEERERGGTVALYRIKRGSKLRFDSLGYSDFARDSYALFERFQAEGIIPQSVRFQVSLPTPLNMLSFFDSADGEEVEVALVEAFTREIETMVRHIPPEKLAIQWDMSREVTILRGFHLLDSPDALTSVISKLNDISAAIPESALLGTHLCCGDRHYKPIQELKDLGSLVNFASVLTKELNHRLDWVQMPVPPDRDDLDYFKPLADLAMGPTKLYLGLVHHNDGVEGALGRIRTAQKVLPDFGVTTECGLGRRRPETIPALLDTFLEYLAHSALPRHDIVRKQSNCYTEMRSIWTPVATQKRKK